MKPILFVFKTDTALPRCLEEVGVAFKLDTVGFAGFTPELVSDCAFVVVSMALVERDDAERLREVFSQVHDVPRAALVDPYKSQQVVQAGSLGLTEHWDKSTSGHIILRKIRSSLKAYGAPELDANVPDATRKGVMEACIAYEGVVLANALNQALPFRQVRDAAFGIAEALRMDGLSVWLSAIQDHHSATFCHCLMVSGLVVQFAEFLDIPEGEQNLLGVGALLHDLGKVKLPLSILDKSGPLSEMEQNLVSLHPEYAQAILDGYPELPYIVRDMAVYHHENLDGTGYPYGLKGDEISRWVRLLSICNAYANLIDTHSGKEGLSPEQALESLSRGKGKLDMDLLGRFRDFILTVPETSSPALLYAKRARA